MDVGGDDALCAAILEMRKLGSVVIVMAHRPSAIAAVNKLMILHKGTLAQFGDKVEVLRSAASRPEPPPSPSGFQPSATTPAPRMQPTSVGPVAKTTSTLPASPESELDSEPEPRDLSGSMSGVSALLQSRRR